MKWRQCVFDAGHRRFCSPLSEINSVAQTFMSRGAIAVRCAARSSRALQQFGLSGRVASPDGPSGVLASPLVLEERLVSGPGDDRGASSPLVHSALCAPAGPMRSVCPGWGARKDDGTATALRTGLMGAAPHMRVRAAARTRIPPHAANMRCSGKA